MSDAGRSPPSPAKAGEEPAPGRRPGGVAEGDGWGAARRFDARSTAQTTPRSDGDGDLLSTPHPSGSARHLPQQSRERGASSGDGRPEIPLQRLEKVESAPGIGMRYEVAEAAPADPVSTPDLMLSLLRSAPGREGLRARLSRLRPDTHGVAPQIDGGNLPLAAPAGRARPENPAQRLENIESAPGNRPTPDHSAIEPSGERRPLAPPEPGDSSRPDNPLQDLEKMESAPGFAPAAKDPGCGAGYVDLTVLTKTSRPVSPFATGVIPRATKGFERVTT